MTWGREAIFPANPVLADILGDMDLDFDSFRFFIVVWIPNFWICRFPDFQNLAWVGLGLDFGNLETWKSRNLEANKNL